MTLHWTKRLFVLPIDDFYLKPAASLELLQSSQNDFCSTPLFSDHGRHQDYGSAFLREGASRLDGGRGPASFRITWRPEGPKRSCRA